MDELEKIPMFYTLLLSVREVTTRLGDGTFQQPELKLILWIYREVQHIIHHIHQLGNEIRLEVEQQYS